MNRDDMDIEYSAELLDLKEGDTEAVHKVADDILCLALRKLGLNKTVDAFRELPKWYS